MVFSAKTNLKFNVYTNMLRMRYSRVGRNVVR